MSLKTWDGLSKEQQTKLQKLIKTKLEDPAWKVTADETVAGIDCLSGKDCAYGTPGKVEVLPISDGDTALAKKILIENVLPAWAGKVDSTVVNKWNDSIGKVTGITASN